MHQWHVWPWIDSNIWGSDMKQALEQTLTLVYINQVLKNLQHSAHLILFTSVPSFIQTFFWNCLTRQIVPDLHESTLKDLPSRLFHLYIQMKFFKSSKNSQSALFQSLFLGYVYKRGSLLRRNFFLCTFEELKQKIGWTFLT